jgi:hypothetical protein
VSARLKIYAADELSAHRRYTTLVKSVHLAQAPENLLAEAAMQDEQTDELLPTIAERGELEGIDGPGSTEAEPEDQDAEPEDAEIID